MEGHQRSFARGKARYAAVSASDFKGEKLHADYVRGISNDRSTHQHKKPEYLAFTIWNTFFAL